MCKWEVPVRLLWEGHTVSTKKNTTSREQSYFRNYFNPPHPDLLSSTGNIFAAAYLHWGSVTKVITHRLNCCSWHQRSRMRTQLITPLHINSYVTFQVCGFPCKVIVPSSAVIQHHKSLKHQQFTWILFFSPLYSTGIRKTKNKVKLCSTKVYFL